MKAFNQRIDISYLLGFSYTHQQHKSRQLQQCTRIFKLQSPKDQHLLGSSTEINGKQHFELERN
jgi:hypothetical protein